MSNKNKTLNAVFICVTNHNRYGLGLTIQEAKKNAGLQLRISPITEYYVQAVVLDNPTEQERGEILNVLGAHPIDGTPGYFGLQDADKFTKEIVQAKHIGWLLVEQHKIAEPKKKQNATR